MKQLTMIPYGKNVFKGAAILLAIVAAFILLNLTSQTALAEAFNDFTYTVNEDGTTATITGYTGTGGDIEIPETVNSLTVTAIDGEVFSAAPVTSVTVPKSVLTIDSHAFNGCLSLVSISVDTENPNYQSVDGIVFSKDGSTLVRYPAAKAGSVYTIPETVATIGSFAFEHSQNLTEVTLTATVSSIGGSAFDACGLLRNAYFMGNAPVVGADIFRGCADEFTVYHTASGTGFANPWSGYASAVFDPAVTHTVSFDLNGAAGTAPSSQTVYDGVKVVSPADPANGSKYFGGWYTESTCVNAWDFGSAVTSDITLFAKWKDFMGSGTEADPYQVSTPEQLNAVRNYPNAHFIMTNDIDMSAATSEGGIYWNGGKGWVPIGTSTTPFMGVFDGDGNQIIGLYINRPQNSFVGLFGLISSSLIENINIVDVNITGAYICGSIAGSCSGNIVKCTATGHITGTAEQSNYGVGGIAGMVSGNISYCTNHAQIFSYVKAGGIVGDIEGDISCCANFGKVTGLGTNVIGGIAGETHGKIQDCYNTADLFQTNTSEYSGGIAGWHYSIHDTYINCYNIGHATFGITACAWLNTTGWSNCYYLEAKADRWEDYGNPVTTIDLKNADTYEGFNFTNTWTMGGEPTYPYAELNGIIQPPVEVISTYDLSAFADGATIYFGTAETGQKILLTNNSNKTSKNIQIICMPGIELTIDNVKIDNGSTSKYCTLSFAGDDNFLILEGDCLIRSGSDRPGIKVEEGTSLEISGNGEIEVSGNSGIGARDGYSAGEITIKSGTINAIGRWDGAGIGGGKNGNGGKITIYGGIVNAQGGQDGGAGIGSGFVWNAGHLVYGGIFTIVGGQVKAKGGYDAAGIGGGGGGYGQSITILGGTVDATGSMDGAGIGGGAGGEAGTISIIGGIVYAQEGSDGAYCDIGCGYNRPGGTVSISGDSIVFLRNGHCLTPATSTHELVSVYSIINSKAFGLSVPETWSGRAYAYLNSNSIYDLVYSPNGGSGYVPAKATQYKDTTIYTASGSTLTKNGLQFEDWNTEADGSGTAYAANIEISLTKDIMLYAIYKEPVHVTNIILSNSSANMTHNDTLKLTATVSPSDATYPTVTWSSSKPSVATVDQIGKVTAIAPGNATITATADGVSDTCTITVEKKAVTSVSLGCATGAIPSSMTAGNSITLTAAVSPADASYKTIAWSSSDSSVASVDQNGKVTAVAPGSATITATADGKSANCSITVISSQFTIAATVNNASYGSVSGGGIYTKGDSATLTAIPNPGFRFVRWMRNDIEISRDRSFSFTVTNDASFVAEFSALPPVSISYTKKDVVSYNGSDGSISLTGSGGTGGSYQFSINGGVNWGGSYFSNLTAGTYTALVRDANETSLTASCTITINQPAFMGRVPATNVAPKASAGTAVMVVPSAPKGSALQSASYSSTNPAVATVDAKGNVSFVGGGKVTIIITTVSQTFDKNGRVKAKTTVTNKTITVIQPIKSVVLNRADATIARKQKVTLVASFDPVSASNKKLKWVSSNPKVATVSGAGVVIGKAGGSAVITCIAQDGSNASASCTVTVTPVYPAGVKLSKSALLLKAGKTAALKATVMPTGTDFKNVSWVSSNPAVAAVDAKGKVIALSSGTAVITAMTGNGKSATCMVTVP